MPTGYEMMQHEIVGLLRTDSLIATGRDQRLTLAIESVTGRRFHLDAAPLE